MQRIIKLVTQRTLTIPASTNVFETKFGTESTSSELTKTRSEWITWILTFVTWTASDSGEHLVFSGVDADDYLKILDKNLAKFLGFTVNTAVNAVAWEIKAPFWGDSQLILQGASHSDGEKRGQSMLKDSPIENSDFKNGTTELSGFNAINDFDFDNFKSGHKLTTHNLDALKKNQVLLFFDADSKGRIASNLNLLGLNWRIKETDNVYLVLENLKIVDQVQLHNTIEVSFSIRYSNKPEL